MLHIFYFIIIPMLLLFFLFYRRRRKCIFIQVSPKLGKLGLRFKLNSVTTPPKAGTKRAANDTSCCVTYHFSICWS